MPQLVVPDVPRVRVPSILQMEASECGAASLAMILASHGRWVSLEEARGACGVSRDGSKASNVLKAARNFGLVAKGFRKDPAELGDLAMPVILHWNFDHFLVLEGIFKGRVHLNDPASGPRIVTLGELDDAFTGVVMAFEPGPEFQRGGAPPSFRRQLAQRLAAVRPELLFILLAAVALVLPGLALPAFSRLFVDGVLVGGQRGWLQPLILGMIATALVRGALTYVEQRLLVRLEARLAVAGAARFVWHVLRLPMSFFAQRHTADIVARIDANDEIARLLSHDLAATLLNAVTATFLGLALLAYDPLLGAVTILLVAPNILLLRAIGSRQAQLNKRALSERNKLRGASIGVLQTIETLKASALEDQAFERWAGYQANLLDARREMGVIGVLLRAAPTLFNALAGAVVLGLGAARVMDGSMTIGTLVAFQTLAASFVAPVAQFVGLSSQVQAVRADMLRIDDAYANPVDPALEEEPDDAAPVVRARGEVEVRGLSFGYNPLEPPLIEGFDLHLRPGARVALVGGSGSGKSTVGKLLAGLAAPWSGEVLIDGRPLETIPPIERAGALATVDQDIFLFEGTVRDNLTLWNPAIPDRTLIRALEDAAILDEVASRTGRLEGAVAEGGANFSGGQRQRLEIARALAGDPAVLILDEATAALDATTEKLIDDNLRRRGATCIIIAHRLSTVRDCDQIVVLRRGRIVERGTHDDLLARGGEYARLIASR